MNDAKPYTLDEFNELRADARPNRIRATVEALEQVTRERDEYRMLYGSRCTVCLGKHRRFMEAVKAAAIELGI